jgi:uncharacterized protein (DUF427 family)
MVVAMSTRLRDVLMAELGELRYEPTEKRIRATLGGRTVIDSTRALLVWEPKRVVASYGVPVGDVDAEIEEGPHEEPGGMPATGAPRLDGRVVLDPSVGFSVHTAAGRPLTLRVRGGDAEAAGFRPSDPALEGFVLLDFAAFDAWYEEDERNLSHPRDPFHRIDIVHSSRHVRVELDGRTLAESGRPLLLFEPPLPVRYYLPREDVRMDLLTPTQTTSHCPFKGDASYFSAPGAKDAFWVYEAPSEQDAKPIAGLLAPWPGRVEVIVDGEPE